MKPVLILKPVQSLTIRRDSRLFPFHMKAKQRKNIYFIFGNWVLGILVFSACQSTAPYDRGFVRVDLVGNGPQEGIINQIAIIEVAMKPIIRSRQDGNDTYIAWLNHNVSEMEICFSMMEMKPSLSSDELCQLTGAWMPFKEKQEFTVLVDWLGQRSYSIKAQFRNTNGAIVPVSPYPTFHPQISFVSSISGIFDSKTPIPLLPTQVREAVAATQTATASTQTAQETNATEQTVFAATHVTGSVTIPGGVNDGGGQTGASPGTTALFDVNFQATSPFAEIIDMRVSTSGTLEVVSWEPYQKQKTFTLEIPVANFFGLSIDVQYRDALGNISPVYHDSIVVEGWPP